MSEKSLRYNENKPKWSLVHYESLVPMIRVLEFGAEKYAPENWKKGLDLKEILESMQRHLAAIMDGKEFDSESGISHMGHIQCNAMFYNYHKDKKEFDMKGFFKWLEDNGKMSYYEGALDASENYVGSNTARLEACDAIEKLKDEYNNKDKNTI